MRRCAAGLVDLGLARGERVGIYLEKRFETVVASFGAAAAGCVFVPLNPVLKPSRSATSCATATCACCSRRPSACSAGSGGVPHSHVVLTERRRAPNSGHAMLRWRLAGCAAQPGHRVIDTDMAAILYTSGSTGKPKGVVLSHRNMVAGAKSVASYLEQRRRTTRCWPRCRSSFDAGFSQLTTAFHAGARVVLINYLLPRDVLKALERERITGLTAVPPL